MAKKKNKKKSKSNVATNPTPSQNDANAVETGAAVEIDEEAAVDREGVEGETSEDMDRDGTNVDKAPVEKVCVAADIPDDTGGTNISVAEDADVMESISFVGDIYMSGAPSASENVMDVINEASKAMDKDHIQSDVKDNREHTEQGNVIDKDKETSDVADDKSSLKDRAEPMEGSTPEESVMMKPLLTEETLKSNNVVDKHVTIGRTSPVKEPIERKQSYEETVALISKSEESVKKGPKLSSYDPWGSFDSTDGMKSRSVVVIEEHKPNIIWNWIAERACCKRKARGYF
jgi:hypothetical protein